MQIVKTGINAIDFFEDNRRGITPEREYDWMNSLECIVILAGFIDEELKRMKEEE